jgi:hypothetical protein
VGWPDETGYADFDDLMFAIYAYGDEWRAEFGPVAQPLGPEALFSFQSYHGGAPVLYALRQGIGHEAFERLEREWVRRYEDKSASTEDFIALASRVARRDLRGFLEDWSTERRRRRCGATRTGRSTRSSRGPQALRAPAAGRTVRPTP